MSNLKSGLPLSKLKADYRCQNYKRTAAVNTKSGPPLSTLKADYRCQNYKRTAAVTTISWAAKRASAVHTQSFYHSYSHTNEAEQNLELNGAHRRSMSTSSSMLRMYSSSISSTVCACGGYAAPEYV
jgi:hypothetical protein